MTKGNLTAADMFRACEELDMDEFLVPAKQQYEAYRASQAERRALNRQLKKSSQPTDQMLHNDTEHHSDHSSDQHQSDHEDDDDQDEEETQPQ